MNAYVHLSYDNDKSILRCSGIFDEGALTPGRVTLPIMHHVARRIIESAQKGGIRIEVRTSEAEWSGSLKGYEIRRDDGVEVRLHAQFATDPILPEMHSFTASAEPTDTPSDLAARLRALADELDGGTQT